MPALSKKLGFDVNMEVCLDRVEVQSWIHRSRAYNIVQNVLAPNIVAFLFTKKWITRTLSIGLHVLDKRDHFQPVKEQTYQRFVKDMLLL